MLANAIIEGLEFEINENVQNNAINNNGKFNQRYYQENSNKRGQTQSHRGRGRDTRPQEEREQDPPELPRIQRKPYIPQNKTKTFNVELKMKKNIIKDLTMSYIRRFYHSLFVPLCEKMEVDPEKVKRIFGRNFVYYASPIDKHTDPEEHRNFINVQHNNTLEWRICQYRNATQDSHCIDVIADMSAKVFNTFCAKVLEMGLYDGQTLTTEQKAELKKAADKAAKQIVKV
jgi:hypothetical protein